MRKYKIYLNRKNMKWQGVSRCKLPSVEYPVLFITVGNGVEDLKVVCGIDERS